MIICVFFQNYLYGHGKRQPIVEINVKLSFLIIQTYHVFVIYIGKRLMFNYFNLSHVLSGTSRFYLSCGIQMYLHLWKPLTKIMYFPLVFLPDLPSTYRSMTSQFKITLFHRCQKVIQRQIWGHLKQNDKCEFMCCHFRSQMCHR